MIGKAYVAKLRPTLSTFVGRFVDWEAHQTEEAHQTSLAGDVYTPSIFIYMSY